MTSWLDAFVGEILQALEESGQAQDTLVVFTSDHGEHLGDHGMWSKGSFYDAAARVPLVMAGPGVPQGCTVDAPVSLIDMASTVLDAFEIEAPDTFEGRSLLPLARGDEDGADRYVLGSYHGHDTNTGQFMIRKDQWKYIYAVGKDARLFNLEDDPGELKDLHGDAGLVEVECELETLLREHFDMEEIDSAARIYQRERFQEWKEIVGSELETRLRAELGDNQYEHLKPIYGI
jgi:choline-sulfatase